MENLVDDVLMTIFSFLDETSLINARKTCLRWRNLIDENCRFYQRFMLKIEAGLQTKKALQKYQDLKYQSIDLNLHGNKFPNEIPEYHKSNIKIAKFHFGSWEVFSKSVEIFENLEKLSFICKHNQHSGISQPIFLPNLKELEIVIEDATKLGVEPNILAPKLKKLLMKSQTPSEQFLLNYPELTSLKFDNFLHKNNKFILPNIYQKLKVLDIDLMISNEMKDFDVGLLNLLKSQKENLKTLRLLSENFHNEIEFAIFDMKVENLTITIPEKFQAFNRPNKTIQDLTLELYNKDTSPNALMNIEKIFKSCPNIRKLTIQSEEDNVENEILEIASTNLKNLSYLVIKNGLGEFPEKINLSTIEKIHIQDPIQICDKDSFKNLLLSCNNLKKIELEGDDEDFMDEIKISSKEFVMLLKNLTNLEEIFSNFGFKLSNKLLDFMRKEKLQLKKLKLEVDEEEFEEQKKLSLKMSQTTNIQCTVMKKI